MTNPIGNDRLSTVNSGAGRPNVDKTPSAIEPPAKAIGEPSADLTVEPDLSHAHQLLADAAPLSTHHLGSAAEAKSALDALKQAMAAQPGLALASFGGLIAAQAQALLNTPTN